MTARTLRLVRDLPAKWDGTPVRWREWRDVWSSADIHWPREACSCGSTARPLRAGGTVLTPSAEHGRAPSWPLWLHAQRCPDCQHDVIYDARTGETWDLGPEDYGRDGSSHVEGSLW